MRYFLVLVFLFAAPAAALALTDSSRVDKSPKDRFVIWLIPSIANNIYGLALGPIGSEAICNKPYTKYSHGINIQLIGEGIFLLATLAKFDFKTFEQPDTRNFPAVTKDTMTKRTVHNGLVFSPFGTFTDQVNGISLSAWMSRGREVNGLSVNLIWNCYKRTNGVSIALVNHSGITKGVQIGVINKTKKLRGFQFGLWNRNEKRALPLLNWNFKK